MNSLKTIYSRLTTMSGAEEALRGVGVEIYQIGENGKEIKPVADILEDLSMVWHDLTAEQQQNLTVTVAGRYQLNRFTALMNNFDVATKATTTALTSQGSAVRENDKYLDSFQARIEKMKNAFTELALAFGEAFLTDGMFIAIDGLKAMANGVKYVFTNFSALSPIMLAIYALTLKMGASKFITAWATNLVKVNQQMQVTRMATQSAQIGADRAREAMASFGIASARAGTQTAVATTGASTGIRAVGTTFATTLGGMKVAWTSFLISTGIGIAIVALGYLIEKLVTHMRKQKEMAEEVAERNKQMVDSYNQLGKTEGLNKLIDEYDTLLDKEEKTAHEQERMIELQNTLANSMDGMVDYIDAQGVAHLKNTNEMKEQVKTAERLAEINAQMVVSQTGKTMKQGATDYQAKLKELNDAYTNLAVVKGKDYDIIGGAYVEKSTEAHTKAILEEEIKIENLKADLTQLTKDVNTNLKTSTLALLDVSGALAHLGDSQKKVIEDVIDLNHEFITANKSSVESQELVMARAIDVGKVFAEVQAEMVDNISSDLTLAQRDQELKNINATLTQVAKTVPRDLLQLDEKGNLKITNNELKGLVKTLSGVSEGKGLRQLTADIMKLGYPMEDARKLAEQLNKEMRNAEIQSLSTADSYGEMGDNLDDYVESMVGALDLTEAMFGSSKAEMSTISELSHYLDLMVHKYGEAVAKQSNEWKKTIETMSEITGLSTEYIEANLQDVEVAFHYLQEIDPISLPDWMTWDEYVDTLDFPDQVKDVLKNPDIVKPYAGVNLTFGVVDKDSLDSDFVSIIDMSQDVIDSVKSLGDIKVDTKAPLSTEFLTELGKIEDKITLIQDEAGNVTIRLRNGETNATIDKLNEEIKATKGNLEVVRGETGELLLVLNQQGEYTLIKGLGDEYEKTRLKGEAVKKQLESVAEAQMELYKKSEIAKNGMVTTIDGTNLSLVTGEIEETEKKFQSSTEALEKYKESLAGVDQAFVTLEGNVTTLVKTEEQLSTMRETFTSIVSDLEKTASNTTNVKELSGAFTTASESLVGFQETISKYEEMGINVDTENLQLLKEEVAQAQSYVDDLSTKLTTIGQTSEEVNLSTIPEVSTFFEQLGTINSSLVNLGTGFKTLQDKGVSGIQTLTSKVTKQTDTMVTKHGQQIYAIDTLAQSARTAKREIELLNTFAQSSSQSVRSYTSSAYDTLNKLAPTIQAKGNPSVGVTSTSNGSYRMQTASSPSISALSVGSGEGDSGSSSNGVGAGTSGTIRPSYQQMRGIDGSSVIQARNADIQFPTWNGSPIKPGSSSSSSSSSKKPSSSVSSAVKERDALYIRDWYKMTAEGFSANLSLFKAQLEGLKEGSEAYRKVLRSILSDENNYLYVITQQMGALNNRNSQIQTRLAQLSNTAKHTNEQREEYNNLLKELEENEGKIHSLRTEVTSATIELRQTAQSVMQDVVKEILQAFDTSLTAITKRISNIDFELEVLEITDTENVSKKMELMADKVREMANQQANYTEAMNQLEAQLATATKNYGKDSDIVKEMTAELEGMQDAWKQTYLEMLKTQAEIKTMRGEIADDVINEMKKHYEKLQKMEEDALKTELDALKKAHKEKLKLYDDEISKVKELYDAKINAIDKEASEDNYNEELAEKNEQLAELQKEQFLLAGDDSLEGRKQYKEKEKEIAELQKEIDKFMLDRQRELLKQQLQDQRDYEVERIESTKEIYDNEMTLQEEAKEKEIEAVTEKYDSIINDEKRWATIRNELIKGNFKVLTDELTNMGIAIGQNADGIFDTLSENFKTYTQEVKDFVSTINGMIGNMNDMGDFNVGNLGNSSPEGIINTSDKVRPQDVPFIIQKSKNGVAMDISSPEKDYLYNLIKNSSISEKFLQEIWKKANSGELLDAPTPDKLMFYNLFQEIIKKSKVKSFDTGGYTGAWGNEGKLAMLHEKELVLNKNQTKDLLDMVKLMEHLPSLLPTLPMVPSSAYQVPSSTVEGDNYEINVNIRSFGGSKQDANNLGKDLVNILKKTGRK